MMNNIYIVTLKYTLRLKLRFNRIYLLHHVWIKLCIFLIVNIFFVEMLTYPEILNESDIIINKGSESYNLDNEDLQQDYASNMNMPVPSFSELDVLANLTGESEPERFDPNYEYSEEYNIVIDNIVIINSINVEEYYWANEVLSNFNDKISVCSTQEQLIKTSLEAVKNIQIIDVSIEAYIKKFVIHLSIPPYNIDLFKVALYTNYDMQRYNYSIDFHFDQIYNIYLNILE